MFQTREENAREAMRDEDRRNARVPVYVIVTGTPSEADDEHVAGFYRVDVDDDLTAEQKAETALDHFHYHNGIACLDDFSIEPIDAAGNWLQRMENHENESLLGCGHYVGDFDYAEQLPEAVQRTLQSAKAPAP